MSNTDWVLFNGNNEYHQGLHTLPRLSGRTITDVEILQEGCLYHLVRVSFSAGGPLILKSFVHYRTPQKVFAAMVESQLQDAEDLMLALPYTEIRQQIQHCCWALEATQLDRLMVLQPQQAKDNPRARRVARVNSQGCLLGGDKPMADVLEGSGEEVASTNVKHDPYTVEIKQRL